MSDFSYRRPGARHGAHAAVVVLSTVIGGACSLATSFDGLSDGKQGPDRTDDGGPDGRSTGVDPRMLDSSTADVVAADSSSDAGLSAYAAAVLLDVPLLYLRLGDDDAAGPAVDSSLRHKDGTFVGGVSLGVPGAIGGDPDTACRFGADSVVVVADSALRFGANKEFTIEAWTRPSAIGPRATHLVAGVTRTPYTEGYSLTYNNQSDNRPSVERDAPTGADMVFAEAGALGAWVHLVGTYDGATLRFYSNGSFVDSRPSAVEIPAGANIPFTVGADGDLLLQHFLGDIDEVAVYDHALLPSRVKAHWDAARPAL